jgi:hypothetical protein
VPSRNEPYENGCAGRQTGVSNALRMTPHFRSSAGFVRSGNSKMKLGVFLRGMRIKSLCRNLPQIRLRRIAL